MLDGNSSPAESAGRASLEADELGRVTGMNQRFTREFGWTREELIGLPLLKLVPDPLHDAFNLRFSRFVEFGESGSLGQPLWMPVVTAAGRTVMTETCLYAERHDRGWHLSAHLERLVERLASAGGKRGSE
jgi:PAS domain S-box-containing protein